MENKQQLEQLLESENWTTEQKEWMLNYLEQNDSTELRELMQQLFARNTNPAIALKDAKAQELLAKIHLLIQPSAPGKIVRFTFRKWMTAAAAIVLMLIAGYWFYSQQKTGTTEQPVAAEQVNDAAPGGNKAVLTLADGSVVVLDAAQNGVLSQQGATSVQKTDDGKIAYNSRESGNDEVLYNTISTPRGGQYQMTLADGSKVWLNAASSLRFPVAFTGKERVVELTGEAYFEIAKNKNQPFKVEVAGKNTVEVLGTHFNINAYADEGSVHTTLLEGKVKVTASANAGTNVLTLAPGEQSQFNTNGQLTKSNTADIEAVMAWKNGKFNFGEEASIEMVMRQITRWYDLEVEYKGEVKGSIGGSISRNVNASKVLEMLEMTGAVKFKMEGKKVIVMPKTK